MNGPEVIARLLCGELDKCSVLTGLQHPYREMADRMLHANGGGTLGALADFLDAMPKDEGKRYWDEILCASDLLGGTHGNA